MQFKNLQFDALAIKLNGPNLKVNPDRDINT